jgi:ectoine hydroxylase-related dioxygenase (phytanoyl-CoA dioxygenase family)
LEAFEEAGIGDLVSAYLGERPVLLAKKLTLRRISLAEGHGVRSDPDWHQDGAFMGRDIHSINVWVSLSHCGVDAPGLDVVARRFDDIVATGTEGANFDWSVGHGLVERIAPTAVVRPVFEPGDALLFDQMMLHRTAARPNMSKVRYAIEAWFAAPSNYPADQLPIAY